LRVLSGIFCRKFGAMEGRPSKMQKLAHATMDEDRTASEFTGESNSADDVDQQIPSSVLTNDAPIENTISNVQLQQQAQVDIGDAITAPPLSKNALKKLKRKEHFEATREQWKADQKEKNKAKKERKREERAIARQNAIADPSVDVTTTPAPQQEKIKPHHQRATHLPITILFDCDFDDLMTDKEVQSLSSQITRSYSENKNSPYRANIVISSFNKRLKTRFDTVLAQFYKGWKNVKFIEQGFDSEEAQAACLTPMEENNGKLRRKIAGGLANYIKDTPSGKRASLPTDGDNTEGTKIDDPTEGEHIRDGTSSEKSGNTIRNPVPKAHPLEAPPHEIIYLTADSDDTLTHLSPHTTYVIGGLIDRNRHKGICYKRASDRGIKTAKFPIKDYLDMASRSVLATNHVVEIMVRWLECGDWGEAFLKVMPKRKGGVLKEATEQKDEEGVESPLEEPEIDVDSTVADVQSHDQGIADTAQQAIDMGEEPIHSREIENPLLVNEEMDMVDLKDAKHPEEGSFAGKETLQEPSKELP
jgi:tRNA (guanine9-N1)-methyltransferase